MIVNHRGHITPYHCQSYSGYSAKRSYFLEIHRSWCNSAAILKFKYWEHAVLWCSSKHRCSVHSRLTSMTLGPYKVRNCRSFGKLLQTVTQIWYVHILSHLEDLKWFLHSRYTSSLRDIKRRHGSHTLLLRVVLYSILCCFVLHDSINILV